MTMMRPDRLLAAIASSLNLNSAKRANANANRAVATLQWAKSWAVNFGVVRRITLKILGDFQSKHCSANQPKALFNLGRV
jgi:hypothetical protein